MKIAGIAFLVAISISCNHKSSSTPEFVITDGMKIIAYTPSGKITIEGKAGFARSYSGDSWATSSVLIPVEKRWNGSLGLYDPVGSSTLGGRLIIQEGKQFFTSESEALRFMKFLSMYFGPLTYNKSGLVIAYKIIEIPNEKPTRSLEVWQLYINGSKPLSLRGAIDTKIEISGGTIPDKASPTPGPIGYEREISAQEYESIQ